MSRPIDVTVTLRLTPYGDGSDEPLDEERVIAELRALLPAMEMFVERIPMGHDEVAFQIEVLDGPIKAGTEST